MTKVSAIRKFFVDLQNNSRFYVFALSILSSVFILSWLRLEIPSDRLFYIRVQQVFGYVAVGYWYVSLIISPLGRLFGKGGRVGYLIFARRAIGVSVFYFGFLHSAIALWGQLGGWAGLGLMPTLFRWSLLFGAVALLVLFFMAITSFDRVIELIGLSRWRWLHRVGYIAGVLTILHIWMIGTHVDYFGVKFGLFVALSLLFGLEAVRVGGNLARRFGWSQVLKQAVVYCIWLVITGLLLVLPRVVQNYHTNQNQTEAHRE